MDERESWSQIVERKIQEAIKRGDFDNLPGAGQPLDLTENPFTPADLRVAFHLLKTSRFAPEWIELDKEIRAELASWHAYVEYHKQWLTGMVAGLPHRPAREREEQRPISPALCNKIAGLRSAHARFLGAHSHRLAGLNRAIERFNWLVPSDRLRRPPVRLERDWVELLDTLLQERGICSE